MLLQWIIIVDKIYLPFYHQFLPILFPFKLILISFQVWRCCNHKFVSDENPMPPIPRFWQLFSATTIFSFLGIFDTILLLSLFWFRGGGLYPYTLHQVWLLFFVHKNFFRTFHIYFLTFGIEHCILLTFGNGIFRISSPIKALYGISTTYSLWYPITDQSERILMHESWCLLWPKFYWFSFYHWSVLVIPFVV